MVKAIFSFLVNLMQFIPWFTTRKDTRDEKRNQTQSVKEHDKNSSDIDAAYRHDK